MKNNYKKYTGTAIAILLTGLAAGVVNGLFGTGGGIVIVLLLSRLYKNSAEYGAKDVFAMTIVSVVVMSVFSAERYFAKGAVTVSDVMPYLMPAAIGGVLGAFLLDKLHAAVMKKIFSVLVIYAGITLLLR